jgi:hypothetical protein
MKGKDKVFSRCRTVLEIVFCIPFGKYRKTDGRISDKPAMVGETGDCFEDIPFPDDSEQPGLLVHGSRSMAGTF